MTYKECPLCRLSEYRIVERYGTMGPGQYACRVVRCNSCGHYFTEISEDIDLGEFYDRGQYIVSDTRGSVFDRVLSVDDLLIIRKLTKLNVSESWKAF